VKDLEREALSPFPPFRLAENHSPFFCRLGFSKDLEREALSPLPPFPACRKSLPIFQISSLRKLVKTRFLRYTFIIEKLRNIQEA